MENKERIVEFGAAVSQITHLHGGWYVSSALRALHPLQERLDYTFQNNLLLLEALTHKSGRTCFKLPFYNEKLVVLGDAVLDYLANSNLLRFTLFERYIERRDTPDYQFGEDFKPIDAT